MTEVVYQTTPEIDAEVARLREKGSQIVFDLNNWYAPWVQAIEYLRRSGEWVELKRFNAINAAESWTEYGAPRKPKRPVGGDNVLPFKPLT